MFEMDHRLVHIVIATGMENPGVRVSVTDAKGHLTELVRRAEAGEEVVLTRHGHPAARIIPITTKPDQEARRVRLEELFASLREEARAHPALPGPSAARSADFLYDEDGLPA
jgi:prevent-host-death family protein